MARKLRIQYPGAIYHVVNRGDHQERISSDDQDRRQLLSTLEEACEKTGWQVHSFCLMYNHFHLVLELQFVLWPKGHTFKVKVATRLRADTTVTIEWIAKRLSMGTRGYLAQILSKNQRDQTEPPLDQPTLNL